MGTTVTVGTDPELFAFNGLSFLSGHDMIPGTKENPFRVRDGFVQVDGVACEFNTFPAETTEEFLFNVKSVRQELDEMVKEFGVRLVAEPTATFDRGYFDSLPPKVRELGCTPDFNAYTGEENEPPSTDEPFRTGAGHLHFGWTSFTDPHDPEHFELCRKVVKQLDAVLYPVSLRWDADEKRRTLYGKMGSFRPKTYGVEYRPLSNKYLNDKKTIAWCFDAGKKAVELLLDEGIQLWTEDTDEQEYLEKKYGIPSYG